MKKSVCSFLILALCVMALSGCSPSGTAKSSEAPPEKSSSSVASTADVAAEEPVKENAAPEDSAEDKEIDEDPGDFILGEWTDNVYSNDFLKVQFPLPDGWVIVTKEELANAMEIGSEFINDDMKFAAKVAELTTIYDMGVSKPETGGSILLCAENLSMSLGGTSLDEDAYASILKEQLSKVEELPYTIGETSQQTIAGQTYTALNTQIEQFDFYQKYLFKRQGKYMITYVCSYTGADEAAVEGAIAGITAK